MSRGLAQRSFPAALWLAAAGLTAACGLDTGGILIGWDGGEGPDPDAVETDWNVDAGDPDVQLPDGGELTDPPLPDLVEVQDVEEVPTCADMGSGYCNDGLECTQDVCYDTPDGPRCRFPVIDGFCVIDGSCIDAHASNPANECEACRPGVSARDWSVREDMAACTGGVCCAGVCRPGGNCCTSTDCGGCSGPGVDCGPLATDVCLTETGCRLESSGTCGGRRPCSSWNSSQTQCQACLCYWDGPGDCDPGTSDICTTQIREPDCTAHADCGCTWTSSGEACVGTYYPCAEIPDEATCLLEDICSWNPSGICDPTLFTCL